MNAYLQKSMARIQRNPAGAAVAAGAGVLLLLLVRFAWVSGAPATWLEVSPDMQLGVGASQPVKVALKYRPRFRRQADARAIAAKIQLLSFPEAVVVAPTTIETTAAAPEAVFTVRGLRGGTEELAFAGSEDPPDPASWRVNSMKAAVAAPRPARPAGRR